MQIKVDSNYPKKKISKVFLLNGHLKNNERPIHTAVINK